MDASPVVPVASARRSSDSLPFLALVALLLFLPGAWTRDLWAPDEPRYAQVAREMVLSGDWLVPRDNQKLYTDKPPLLFWLIGLSSLPAGDVGEASARLPVILCAVGTVLLTAGLGRLWFGRFGGFAAGLILATSLRGFVSAQWVQTDGPLAFFVTLSILGMARVRAGEGPARWPDLLLVHGGIAGALLAKGPVGFALPLLVACGWAAAERRPGFLWRLQPWLLVAAAAPALAWAAAAAHFSQGQYALGETLRRHVLERFAHGMHHVRHPLYLLAVFPLELLPWSAFLLAWAAPPTPVAPQARAGRRLAFLWLLLPLMLFTLSAEKRSVYLLPLMPAAALLVAGAWPPGRWPQAGEAGRARSLVPFAALLALSGLVLGLCVALPASRLPPEIAARLPRWAPALWAAGAASVAAAAAGWRAARRGRGRAALGWAGAAGAALLLGASLAVAPLVDPLKSARSICERAQRRLQAGERLCVFPFYRAAYAFYSGRSLEEIGEVAELERFLEAGGSYCFADREAYGRLPAVLRERYPPLEEAAVGHRGTVLIGSPRPLTSAATARRRSPPAPAP